MPADLLEPIDKADYVFINHARWDSSLPRVMLEQFLKPTFWTYVLANLRANRVGAMPSLYRADAAAGRKLTMPVLVLWGASGLFGQLPALDVWRDYADEVKGAAIPECGHFLPEEQPERVVGELTGFLPNLAG